MGDASIFKSWMWEAITPCQVIPIPWQAPVRCLALAPLSKITEHPSSPEASPRNKLTVPPSPCFLGLPTLPLAFVWCGRPLSFGWTASPYLILPCCAASFRCLPSAAHLPGILMLSLEEKRPKPVSSPIKCPQPTNVPLSATTLLPPPSFPLFPCYILKAIIFFLSSPPCLPPLSFFPCNAGE